VRAHYDQGQVLKRIAGRVRRINTEMAKTRHSVEEVQQGHLGIENTADSRAVHMKPRKNWSMPVMSCVSQLDPGIVPRVPQPRQPKRKASKQELLREEDYCCAICSDVLLEPVVGACGHDFCHDCLDTWRSVCATGSGPGTLVCPLCRSELPQVPGVCRRLSEMVESCFPEQVKRRRAESQAQHKESDKRRAQLCALKALIDQQAAEEAAQQAQQAQQHHAQVHALQASGSMRLLERSLSLASQPVTAVTLPPSPARSTPAVPTAQLLASPSSAGLQGRLSSTEAWSNVLGLNQPSQLSHLVGSPPRAPAHSFVMAPSHMSAEHNMGNNSGSWAVPAATAAEVCVTPLRAGAYTFPSAVTQTPASQLATPMHSSAVTESPAHLPTPMLAVRPVAAAASTLTGAGVSQTTGGFVTDAARGAVTRVTSLDMDPPVALDAVVASATAVTVRQRPAHYRRDSQSSSVLGGAVTVAAAAAVTAEMGGMHREPITAAVPLDVLALVAEHVQGQAGAAVTAPGEARVLAPVMTPTRSGYNPAAVTAAGTPSLPPLSMRPLRPAGGSPPITPRASVGLTSNAGMAAAATAVPMPPARNASGGQRSPRAGPFNPFAQAADEDADAAAAELVALAAAASAEPETCDSEPCTPRAGGASAVTAASRFFGAFAPTPGSPWPGYDPSAACAAVASTPRTSAAALAAANPFATVAPVAFGSQQALVGSSGHGHGNATSSPQPAVAQNTSRFSQAILRSRHHQHHQASEGGAAAGSGGGGATMEASSINMGAPGPHSRGVARRLFTSPSPISSGSWVLRPSQGLLPVRAPNPMAALPAHGSLAAASTSTSTPASTTTTSPANHPPPSQLARQPIATILQLASPTMPAGPVVPAAAAPVLGAHALPHVFPSPAALAAAQMQAQAAASQAHAAALDGAAVMRQAVQVATAALAQNAQQQQQGGGAGGERQDTMMADAATAAAAGGAQISEAAAVAAAVAAAAAEVERWQSSEGDRSLRSACGSAVASVFVQHFQDQLGADHPRVALYGYVRAIEEYLYRSASSRRDYSDLSTLQERVVSAVHAITGAMIP